MRTGYAGRCFQLYRSNVKGAEEKRDSRIRGLDSEPMLAPKSQLKAEASRSPAAFGESPDCPKNIPQGLKSSDSIDFIGTAEAVPFQNRLSPQVANFQLLFSAIHSNYFACNSITSIEYGGTV